MSTAHRPAPVHSAALAALEFEHLVVDYGAKRALDGLDLLVPEGGCFGLLGPNGAGKTTAVAVAATLLRPTSGNARVFGIDSVLGRSDVRRSIGIVFQEPSLDPLLTAREHLDLQARLYRLEDRRGQVERALEGAGLTGEGDRPVAGFSGGMKRRLEIARGLLHAPRLLFLDEPTLGLDVGARHAVWDQLRELQARRTTLFLTTHAMEEADALCDELAILDRGRIVARGTPEGLKSGLGGDVVWLRVDDADRALAQLSQLPGLGEIAQAEPGRLRIVVADGPGRLAAMLDAVRGCGVTDVHLERPTLEHVFLHYTGREFAAAERAS